jgi:hypothetical protein
MRRGDERARPDQPKRRILADLRRLHEHPVEHDRAERGGLLEQPGDVPGLLHGHDRQHEPPGFSQLLLAQALGQIRLHLQQRYRRRRPHRLTAAQADRNREPDLALGLWLFEQLEPFLGTIPGPLRGLMSAPSDATLLGGILLAAFLLASPGMLLGQGRALLKRLRGSTQHSRNIPSGHPRLIQRSLGFL